MPKISIPIQDLQNPNLILQHKDQIEKALLENPENPDLYVIKSVICLQEKRYDEALSYVRQALGFNPRNAGIYVTFAAIYDELGLRKECTSCLETAYRECNCVPALNWNYALNLLARGEWELGWDLYRWRRVHLPGHMRMIQPVWEGKEVSQDKTLFIWCEQGLGDCLMNFRFIKQLKEKFEFKWICLEVPDELYTLACRHNEGIDQIFIRYPDGHMPFSFDMHCSIMDLPYILGLSNPCQVDPEPYITGHSGVKQRWDEDFIENKVEGLKIGINWYGASGHQNNKRRSACLKDFEPLQEFGTLFAIQKDVEDIPNNERPETMKLLSAHSGLVNADFTTGCIAAMDVIVTIDSFVAHLAGAMGKKVFLLLPFISEWRWQYGEETGKSYWYKDVHLIKQTVRDSWKEPIENVLHRLANNN